MSRKKDPLPMAMYFLAKRDAERYIQGRFARQTRPLRVSRVMKPQPPAKQLDCPETTTGKCWAGRHDAGGCIMPLVFCIVACPERERQALTSVSSEANERELPWVRAFGRPCPRPRCCCCTVASQPNLAGLGSPKKKKSNQRPWPKLQTPLATAATHIIRGPFATIGTIGW